MSELEKQLMDAHRKHTRASTVASTSLYEKAADRIEEQAAEIERLRQDRGRLRELIAKLYCASGCSCCRDDEAWEAAANALGEMLDAPEWDDKSLGRNWYAVRDEYAALEGKAEQ